MRIPSFVNPWSRVVVPLVLALGCGPLPADSPPEPDATPAAAADALTLDRSEKDHVAGRFTRGGVVLAFDFAREGDVRVATLRTGDGRELASSTLRDGIETLTVLGGRLVVSGPSRTPDPELTGDRAALEEMQGMPEILLLPAVRDALTNAGVDPDLHTAKKTTERGAMSYYNNGDGYWHLGPGEARSFGTWALWTPTWVLLRDFGSVCATVAFHVGWATETNVVQPGWYNVRWFQRYWWGVVLTVQNLNSSIYWGPGVTCGPAEIGVYVQ